MTHLANTRAPLAPLLAALPLAGALLIGCGEAHDPLTGDPNAGATPELGGAADDGRSTSARAPKDPLLMPSAIVNYQQRFGWGDHHIRWHVERNWNRLDADGLKWAQGQGWSKARLQEGEKGNGLEFMAMHRAMLQMLRTTFPRYTHLFDGWQTVPTDPNDKSFPVPGNKTDFDANMLAAIDRLTNHLDSFADDDELGLFIETSLRPTKDNPNARSTDKGAGIHNYLHNRFADPNSAITIGDPQVNMMNKRFWQLHGWIDARWTEFRKLKGLADDQPTYALAMQAAQAEMHMLPPVGNKVRGVYDPMPDSVRDLVSGGPANTVDQLPDDGSADGTNDGSDPTL